MEVATAFLHIFVVLSSLSVSSSDRPTIASIEHWIMFHSTTAAIAPVVHAAHARTYSQLFDLRADSPARPDLAVRRAFVTACRPRGRRAGRNLQRAIPVVMTSRGSVYKHSVVHSNVVAEQHPSSSTRRCSLLPVPLTSAVGAQRIQVGEFNAHSVGNKSTSVCDWIADNSLHLAAVVETWHGGIDRPEFS